MSTKFVIFAVLKLCLAMRYPLYIEASEETFDKAKANEGQLPDSTNVWARLCGARDI